MLLAHEVGHYIDRVQHWSSEIEENEPIFFDEDLQIPENITEDEYNITNSICMQIGASWISEIIADVIATSVMGPAYVLALAEFMFIDPNISKRPKKISESHPPEQLRLKLMAQVALDFYFNPLEDNGKLDLLTPESKSLYHLVKETIGSYINNESLQINAVSGTVVSQDMAQWIYSRLIRGMNKVIQIAMKKSSRTFKENWTCTSMDVLHALILQNYLEQGLTPTELPNNMRNNGTKQPSLAAVLNSGWFYLIRKKYQGKYLLFQSDTDLRTEDINERYTAIHQLVAKSVETLNFQRQYQREKGTNLK